MLRQPRGGVEDVQEMRNSGMHWIACNVGDYPEASWDLVRVRAENAGVMCIPWSRTYVADDVKKLTEVAFSIWNCPGLIVNLENEAQTTLPPWRVRNELEGLPSEFIGISTISWLYNDVDWRPIGHLPALLQIFPQDARWEVADIQMKQGHCVHHAREMGFRNVGVTYQTYGGAQPSWYAFNKGVRSYYTGDDIGGGQWAPWAL